MVPAKVVKAAYIHKLAWGAVGLGGIEDKLSIETKDFSYDFGQFADGNVFSCTDIDQWRSVFVEQGVVLSVVEVHQEEAGLSQIIRIEQFAAGSSGSPYGNLAGLGLDGLGCLSDKGWQNVRVGKVEVVVGAIEIGRHGGQKLRFVLPVVAPAHLDACDFGQCIRAVSG